MRFLPALLLTVLSLGSAQAARNNPYCGLFNSIQSTIRQIDGQGVDRILPHADWLENVYRRRDQTTQIMVVGRTVVLVAIQRLSWVSYVFTPSRAEDGSFTAYYIRSPQNFAKFLELSPRTACQYLSAPDRQAEILRSYTVQVYDTLEAAK